VGRMKLTAKEMGKTILQMQKIVDFRLAQPFLSGNRDDGRR